jgi:hypothetical protein
LIVLFRRLLLSDRSPLLKRAPSPLIGLLLLERTLLLSCQVRFRGFRRRSSRTFLGAQQLRRKLRLRRRR